MGWISSLFGTRTPSPETPGEPAPAPSRGLLALLRQTLPWLGPRLAHQTGTDFEVRQEKVRSGPQGIILPWFLPYFDPQQTMGETQQHRLAYRHMLSNPYVKSAFLGKVLAVGALSLKVLPANKRDPNDRKVAEFIEWNLGRRVHGGVPGLAWSILAGGLIDGYSVCEKVWTYQERGTHAGQYALQALKPKDTGYDVVLQTDEHRNVVGVMGLRYNPGTVFAPANFLLYRHLPLWDLPTGMSDFRAAYAAYWLLDTVTKLRGVSAEKRSMPVLMGKYPQGSPAVQSSLERSLALARSQTWLAIPDSTQVEALNIAGSAESDFKSFVSDLKHDIFVGLAGAMLQALEGDTTDGRGNSQVHRSTADLFVWHLASCLETLFNDEDTGLVRDLVDLNFVVNDYPQVKLSAVDVNELVQELAIDTGLHALGVPLSTEELYEKYGRKPPESPEDALAPQQAPQPGGPGGEPGKAPDAPPEAPPAPEAPKAPDAPPPPGGGAASPFDAHAEDAQGHEHKGKGEGGGQFTGKGNDGGGGSDPGASGKEHGSPNQSLPDAARPVLSDTEARAVHDYTNEAYDELNATLRAGKEPSGDMAKLHSTLLGALARVKTFDQPVQAYRGMNMRGEEGKAFLERARQAAVSGERMRFGGYLSTTTGTSFVEGYPILVQMEVVRGLDVKSFSKHPKEDEMLLEPDSVFEVKGVRKVRRDESFEADWIVEVRQVLGDHKKSSAAEHSEQTKSVSDRSGRFVDEDDSHIDWLPPFRESFAEEYESFAAGFTGEKKDSLGRRICFQQGKRVTCPKRIQPPKPVKLTTDQVHKSIQGLKAAGVTHQGLQIIAGHIGQLSLKEIADLKARLGVKASGNKSVMARKILAKATAPTRPTPAALAARVQALRAGKPTAADIAALAADLAQLPMKEIVQVKAALKVRAAGPKAQLARKIAERALAPPKPAPRTRPTQPPAQPTPAPPPATPASGANPFAGDTKMAPAWGRLQAAQANARGGQFSPVYLSQMASDVLDGLDYDQKRKLLNAAGIARAGSYLGDLYDHLQALQSPPVAAASPSASPAANTPKAPPNTPDKAWTTGKPEAGTLNGVPFASAPPKFWEKTKDVDVAEPPLRPNLTRAGVLIQEPDGRVWIVQPTNGFGGRNHTLPGGTLEKGLSTQQNALKEVWEETGLQVEITGYAGDFNDSNYKSGLPGERFGRLYIGRRVGGAPWDAKIESHIISKKTNKAAAESETVTLVTPERAAQLLHRTDDLAQLAVVRPIPVDAPTTGKGSEPLKKLLEALGPRAAAYKQKALAATGKPGVPELHAAQEMRGFNKAPAVVSKNDMDALLAKGGHVEMLRGVKALYTPSGKLTAAQLAEQFRTGGHHPGNGCFGSGTYADSSKGRINAASGYARNGTDVGATMRMALPRTAKIIKHSELEKLVPQAPDGFPKPDGHSKDDEWLGVQAALAGYDAIEVDGKSTRHSSYGKGYYVILNRGIVTVQKEDATGHMIK